MKSMSNSITSIDFSQTNAIYDGGQTAKLDQGFALIFKKKFGIYVILN